MSRRRYISTDISTDTAVNRLAVRSDFAALLYTWLIPHCTDDASVHADAEEILLLVMPGRRDKSVEDVEAALLIMEELGLISFDGKSVNFPPAAFYKYQSYIKDGERRGTHNTAESRMDKSNSADQRKTAQNSASFKSSFSLSSSISSPPPTTTSTEVGETSPRKPKTIKVPIPDDFANMVPVDVFDAISIEQHMSVQELNAETAKMVDHFRANGERKVDWVAAWRNWMRSPYRKTAPLANGRASPNGVSPPDPFSPEFPAWERQQRIALGLDKPEGQTP